MNKFKISVLEDKKSNVALTLEQMLEAQYTEAVTHSSMPILLADIKGDVMFANDAAKAFFSTHESKIKVQAHNFSASAILGQNIDSFINPHSYAVAKGKNLSKQSYEQQFSELHCILNYIPIYRPEGQHIGTMIEWVDVSQTKKQGAIIDSIDKSQAVIEFTPEGIIKSANANFVAGMGYQLSEIIGEHHRMFMPEDMKNSLEYRAFWKRLEAGEFFSDEVKRVAKGGREIWLSASYNPLFDEDGKVTGVIKFASDITEHKVQINDFIGQIDAINKSQAVIEFNMDGTIRCANDAFLTTTGYKLDEISGKHHRIFMSKDDALSDDYAALWKDLNKGLFFSDEIKRVAKDGSILWLQASYNPIFDSNGKPYKVVKYASNITERKNTIETIRNVIIQLSAGDLTASVDLDEHNEFFDLASSINNLISNLSRIIDDMREASVTIKNASTEIAKGNADLSTRTEQQASSIEETVSTMEELTNAVGQNSKNANQANRLAMDASQVATRGGSLIREVVATMVSITESSRKISDIIGVIDGIAFQTNILALNAAVEAARAGEQGRGFAVVASEVRNLAQRSANAAKDIKALISDSVSKIENGNELVNESGGTMEQIVTSITEVNKIMSHIDAASAEQATGIAEIGQAIKQMDDVTQQNAALVEEAAAASESMQGQATQLANIVSTFKLMH
ncbi:methyl-accepting chemotaxis protein [Glaciecola sp. SC05]|uniref:methyl-accepting chemotaxis protein n=1 Tax=Glaciecola sp. SC05 TaxID=1987355 RepID=UPI003527F7A2